MYLGRALQCIDKARLDVVRVNARSEHQPPLLLLLQLEEDILLRLTYALLKSRRLHEGLEAARRLNVATMALGKEMSQNRSVLVNLSYSA